ncbi:MAG: TonB-dependent receptor [Pseudomonadota bacterium]
MGRVSYLASTSTAILLAISIAVPATAQDPAIELQGIVISEARKWREDFRRVPGSLDVFTGKELEESLARDIRDSVSLSANAHIKETNAESLIVIRGIGSYDTAIYGPVGVFINGVALPVNFMHNFNLSHIERLEVLKGPQGTIYGRNTEAGAIVVTTRRPGDEPSVQVNVEGSYFDTNHGNQPGYTLGGRVSTPLVKDKLAMSFAGQFKSSDGFINNVTLNDEQAADIDEIDTQTGIVFTPSRAFKVSLSHTFQRSENGKDFFRFETGPSATQAFTVTHDQESEQRDRTHVAGATVTYDMGGLQATSITGGTHFTRDFVLDFNSTPFPGVTNFALEDRMFSQELRLTSGKDGDAVRWLFGGYGFKEQLDVSFDLAGVGVRRDTEVDTKGLAVFGQATVELTKRLRLTGGLRFERLDLSGALDFTTGFGTQRFAEDLSYNTWLPTASLAFDVTDNAMAYARVSRGYQSGGYNYSFANSLDSLTFDPEYTWNYEFGTKISNSDKSLTIAAALFYIDARDKQVTELLPGGAQRISNAPKVHAKGAEVSAKVNPLSGLELFGGVGFTQTRVDEFIGTASNGMGGVVPFNFKGKELPNAPSFTYHLGTQYTHSHGWFGRIDILGTGAFFFDPANALKQDSYVVTNLQVGRKWDNFEVTLWSKNLLDERYFTSAVNFFGSKLVEDGAPRSFGIKAKATW